MKVSELSGAQLDYWVAKALGLKPIADDDPEYGVRIDPYVPEGMEMEGPWYDRFAPSKFWQQGGPIIDRDDIQLGGYGTNRQAEIRDDSKPWVLQWGETTLIAAMRAKVAHVYGEEVPDGN